MREYGVSFRVACVVSRDNIICCRHVLSKFNSGAIKTVRWCDVWEEFQPRIPSVFFFFFIVIIAMAVEGRSYVYCWEVFMSGNPGKVVVRRRKYDSHFIRELLKRRIS